MLPTSSLTVPDIIGVAAALLPAARTEAAFDTLCERLAVHLSFENFIVFVFETNAAPVLFQTNLGLPWLKARMTDYFNGLYTLDPFFRLTQERQSGLFRMRDIMPEAFLKSSYYNHFYKHTIVTDEVRYILQCGDVSTHVIIEREGDDRPFDDAEMDLLSELEPLISSFVAVHEEWRSGSGTTPGMTFELNELSVVRTFGATRGVN